MKLHIVSDGYLNGTIVLDDDGNMIEGVTRVTWTLDAAGDGLARATLEFDYLAIDAKGET